MWRINDYLSVLRWQEDYLELLPYFACGSLIYLLRDKIPISPILIVGAFLVLLLTLRTDVFKQAFALAGSYLIIYFAFSRRLQFDNFAKKGDFSYGVYIYAFPVQQAVSQTLAPDINWLGNFSISFPIILICAIASWHWVEGPALSTKKRLHAILISK